MVPQYKAHIRIMGLYEFCIGVLSVYPSENCPLESVINKVGTERSRLKSWRARKTAKQNYLMPGIATQASHHGIGSQAHDKYGSIRSHSQFGRKASVYMSLWTPSAMSCTFSKRSDAKNVCANQHVCTYWGWQGMPSGYVLLQGQYLLVASVWRHTKAGLALA